MVPLNAGNVLGAKDGRPIPKWEAIIRRTLNGSSKPEANYKSYSAPSSPILSTSSVANILDDEVVVTALELNPEESVLTANGFGTGRCELEGTDAKAPVVPSNLKLRRVVSSSGRIGFNWMESPLVHSPHIFLNGSALKRSNGSVGDMALILTEQQERPELLQELLDASGKSSEEDDSFCEMTDEELNSVGVEDFKSRPNFGSSKVKETYKQLESLSSRSRAYGGTWETSQIFWFGNLNYRLNMLDTEIKKLVASEQWDKLMNSHQVRLRAPPL
ncbi:hypothetical protein Ancab_029846 [Ancistrocladus abbreviatus]